MVFHFCTHTPFESELEHGVETIYRLMCWLIFFQLVKHFSYHFVPNKYSQTTKTLGTYMNRKYKLLSQENLCRPITMERNCKMTHEYQLGQKFPWMFSSCKCSTYKRLFVDWVTGRLLLEEFDLQRKKASTLLYGRKQSLLLIHYFPQFFSRPSFFRYSGTFSHQIRNT